jgi:pyrroline-5-carboxylate reductase
MTSSDKSTLGILGTGHLATYTVTGLRTSNDTRRIIVSPRNAIRAQNLKHNFGCEVAANNQAVIDNSEVVLLAVRPWQTAELLAGLVFPSNKTVVSAIAGVNLGQLREMAELPDQLALILPVVAAENAQGFVPIYPALDAVKCLASSLGEPIAFEQECQFAATATMACLHGWLYRFFDEQVNWLTGQGIDAQAARKIVLHNTLGAAHYALGRPDQDLKELASEIARDGTFTKIGLDQLEGQGAFTQWSDALDTLKKKFDAEAS